MIRDICINGKKIGEISEKTFITWRKSEHYFKKYQGFAISTSVINTLLKSSVNRLVIHYTGVKYDEMFIVSLDDFIEYGKEYLDTSMGFDDYQVVCPCTYMKSYKQSKSNYKELHGVKKNG